MVGLVRRKRADWIFGKLQLAVATAILIFGASLKVDLTRVWPFDRPIRWMQNWAWLVVVSGPILVAILQSLRRKFGSPWAWEAIQKLLDTFRNDVFGHLADEPLDYHRVTLFRHRRLCIGLRRPSKWKNRLVAVARSDHLTKLKIQDFRAPDDAERCEGVAGIAWRCKGWVIVPVPGVSLTVPNDSRMTAEIKIYAASTGVAPDDVTRKLSQGRKLAANYAALIVQLRGIPWGVIVLDSRKPDTIDREKLQGYKAYGSLLTPLLERV